MSHPPKPSSAQSRKSRSQATKPVRPRRAAATSVIPLDELQDLYAQAHRFERLQQSLLKTPGQAFYVYDHENKGFLIGEEEHAALYGYTVAEIHALPLSWQSLHHPDDLARIAQWLADYKTTAPNRSVTETQLRILRKDGSWEWIAVHRKPLKVREDGTILTEMGVARIITQELNAIREKHVTEERFRALFDGVPVAILVAEPSGVVIEANRSAYLDLKVRSGALKGRRLDQLVSHADRTALRAALRALKAGAEDRHSLMARWNRDDGTTYPAESAITVLPDQKILVTMADRSDRESQEEALRQQEECYEGMFLRNPFGVAVVDSQGCFLDANPAFLKMIDMAREQVVGLLSLPDVVSGPSKALANQLVRQVKRPGKPSPPSEMELLAHGDGTPLPVETILTVLHGEARRADHRGIIVFHNIQQRKEAEAALHRETAISRVLLDNAPIAIGLLTPAGEVIRLNATAEELFGYRTDEVKGQSLWDLPIMDADEVIKSKRRFQELADGAKSVHASLTIRNRRGEARIVEAETTALRTYGGVDFLITTGIDTTDRRRLESEVIRVAEAEQIRIGHDLHDGVGQTLTGIGALISALEEGLEGQARQDAARIRELVSSAITENRRISHGLSPAAVKNRGLSGGLLLLAETVRNVFRTECLCELDPKVGWLEEEHAIHAFRIAQEAVSNAYRHGSAKKIRIRLVLREPGRCGMEIIDNGRGFRTGGPKKNSEGIGIRVMRYRADLIGGELHLRSAPGKGTHVILEMMCGKPRNVGLTSENGEFQ